MRNKKGFTLIELLAIIIILALLIVLAVPAILKTIRQAREESFIVQAKSIAKAAQQKYELDSFTSGVKTSYGTGELSLSSTSSSLFYCVNLNQNGTFKNIKVFDTDQRLKVQGTSFDNMQIVEYVEGETLVCDGTYDPGVTPGQSSSEVCTTDCPSSSDVPEVDQTEAPCEDCGPVSNVPVPISNGDGSFYIYTVGYFKKVSSNTNGAYRYSFSIGNLDLDLNNYDLEIESYSLMNSLTDFTNYKQFKQQYSSRLVNNSNTNSDAVATDQELYDHRASSSELTVNHVYMSCGKTNCIITIDAAYQLSPSLNWHSTTTNGGTDIDVIYPGIKIKVVPSRVNKLYTVTEDVLAYGQTINPSEYSNNITEDSYLKIYYNSSHTISAFEVCYNNGICLNPNSIEAGKLLLKSKYGVETTYSSTSKKCYDDQTTGSLVCGGSGSFPWISVSSSLINVSTRITQARSAQNIYGSCGISISTNQATCSYKKTNSLVIYRTQTTGDSKNLSFEILLTDGRIITVDGDELNINSGSLQLGVNYDLIVNQENNALGTMFYDVTHIRPLNGNGHLELYITTIQDIDNPPEGSYIPVDNNWYELTQDTAIIQSKSSSPDPNCIDTETLVTMADGSLKKLGDIEVGDEVLSVDWNTKKLISRKVIYSGKEYYDEWKVNVYWENKFSDGTIIKQAMRHRFYSLESESFVHLHDWTVGLHAYKIDGTNPTLVSRKLVQGEIHYARITLEDDNNYFANGLLTGDSESQAGIPLTEFLPRE